MQSVHNILYHFNYSQYPIQGALVVHLISEFVTFFRVPSYNIVYSKLYI